MLESSRTRLFAPVLFASAALMSVNSGSLFAADSDVLISKEAAARTLNPNEISVAAAERIAKSCVEYATAKGWSLGVVVLGPSGNIVYAYRMDGRSTPPGARPRRCCTCAAPRTR